MKKLMLLAVCAMAIMMSCNKKGQTAGAAAPGDSTVTDSVVVEKKAIDLEGIAKAIEGATYLTKFEKGLKWYTDVYTYSLSIALINSLLFVPVAKLNGIVDKILYITNYNDINITAPFAGHAGIPEFVWGLFLTAFAVLPIIYFATSNKRK